jgi:hypothetical protein
LSQSLKEQAAEILEKDMGPRNKATLWSLEELHTKAVALANGHGSDLDGDEALPEVLECLMDCLDDLDTDEDEDGISELDVLRALLRHECLVSKLVEDGEMTFEGEFHGSGDSGNTDIHTGRPDVDKLLEYMIEKHVNFDWWNSDGGYGDVTWHVQEDKVVINGSYYVTESVTEMDEEEF